MAKRPKQDKQNTTDRTTDQGKARSAAGDAGNELPPSAEKDPAEWVTGDESMTGPQASYLRTLSQEAGVEFDEGLTKAEASRRIDELQAQTGRGRDH